MKKRVAMMSKVFDMPLIFLGRGGASDGVQIFIETEGGYGGMFDNLSLIVSPYTLEDEEIRLLAVLGPLAFPTEKSFLQ